MSWQGHAAGTLESLQQFYFAAPRPRDELYDTLSDPYEVHNIVHHADVGGVLSRMRAEMDAWLARVGDLSAEPESEMIARMWPNGEQPKTAMPDVQTCGGAMSFASDTPGASVGYRIGRGDSAGPWQLYTAPVDVPSGTRVEAKAVRYGYQESDVAVWHQPE
jgi:hypothetical protein